MARSTVPNPSQRVAEVPAGAEGAGARESRLEVPAAVILAGDILRWVIPKVGKLPKNVRFGLGARIEIAHFDVFEELTRAQYVRGGDRGRAIELAKTRLRIARHLSRMARGKIQLCVTGNRTRARALPQTG